MSTIWLLFLLKNNHIHSINRSSCVFLVAQAMRFGDLPAWATELSNSIREVVHYSDYAFESMNTAACDKDKENCPFPSHLLWREPLFNQLITNIYQPGEVRYFLSRFRF